MQPWIHLMGAWNNARCYIKGKLIHHPKWFSGVSDNQARTLKTAVGPAAWEAGDRGTRNPASGLVFSRRATIAPQIQKESHPAAG